MKISENCRFFVKFWLILLLLSACSPKDRTAPVPLAVPASTAVPVPVPQPTREQPIQLNLADEEMEIFAKTPVGGAFTVFVPHRDGCNLCQVTFVKIGKKRAKRAESIMRCTTNVCADEESLAVKPEEKEEGGGHVEHD